MIKRIVQSFKVPKNQIILIHVRLKGLDKINNYKEVTRILLEEIDRIYEPKTILVPTFTYSFTKTGVYDRVNTQSETGRFGEEARSLFPYQHRTLNPVFNFIDTNSIFTCNLALEKSAFGIDSLLHLLAQTGYVIINLNLNKLINTHLHYIEYHHKVHYRYEKIFDGKISLDGSNFENIEYSYFVRNLDIDTTWRREKVLNVMKKNKAIREYNYGGINVNWISSQDMDDIFNRILIENPNFLITD